MKINQYYHLRKKGFSIAKSAEMSKLYEPESSTIIFLMLIGLVWAMININLVMADARLTKSINDLRIVKAKRVAVESLKKVAQLENVIIECLNDGVITLNKYTHECKIKKL